MITSDKPWSPPIAAARAAAVRIAEEEFEKKRDDEITNRSKSTESADKRGVGEGGEEEEVWRIGGMGWARWDWMGYRLAKPMMKEGGRECWEEVGPGGLVRADVVDHSGEKIKKEGFCGRGSAHPVGEVCGIGRGQG